MAFSKGLRYASSALTPRQRNGYNCRTPCRASAGPAGQNQLVSIILKVDVTVMIAFEHTEHDQHHGPVDLLIEKRCIEESRIGPLHIVQHFLQLKIGDGVAMLNIRLADDLLCYVYSVVSHNRSSMFSAAKTLIISYLR